MSKLELLLLGHFECLLPSGEPVTLPMRKAEVLLAYLALAPGIRHPRERLINLLWSNRGEEQARNSLRQCLSTIRKSLGDAAELALQVDRSSVRLNPELIEVDALEFERLAADAEFEALADAAELYRGEFLEGISIRDAASQEWLDSERSRFKRQYIEILANLGHVQLASRNYSDAIRTTERLVEQDLLNESGWRLLMRACHENGDRSHALQAFKRCQQVMRDELDVAPEAETIALRDAIASGQVKADTPVPSTSTTVEPVVPATAATDDHSIAVLPFDNLSGDPEQEYFSDGITDSIILNLAMFPGLQVKSRNSSFAFKEQIKSVGEICDELQVDYIVEGNVRRSQDRIRITVQLIESRAGNQIWGRRYDADLCDLFSLEEELSRNIAATVTGQIESNLQRIAIAKGAADQQAYDLLLAGIYHLYHSTREHISIAIDKLDQSLALDPNNVRAHATIYQCHILNWMDRLVEDYPQSFELAGKHARKAMALDPNLGDAQYTYGEYLMFCHEHQQAGIHLDRALSSNPNNPTYLTARAMHHSLQGEFEEAINVAERAYQLDPYNWWVDWNMAEAHFLCNRYQETLDIIARSRNAPGFIRIYGVASNVKLGNLDIARQALSEYLQACRESMRAMPRTLDDWLQYTVDTAPFADPQINQDIVDCLVQAGLEDALAASAGPAEPSKFPSILVLPFSNLSGDPEQEYFSDGITESIIINLSLFSGLNVKSRHASFAFKDSTKDLDEIARELGVKYIVEGSIRKYTDKVRITAQLADTETGNQVWGKRFDYDLADLFTLEAELVQTIAGTVRGRIGHDARVSSMHKPARDLRSYDYLMRGSYHLEKFNAEDSKIAREQLGKCLEIDPGNAEAHAQLGIALSIEVVENWTHDPQGAREESLRHLQTALKLQPENAYTHAYLAEYQMFTRDFKLGLFHADRSIELNPTLPDGYNVKAYLLAIAGKIDDALKNAEISIQIDPYSYYVGWNAGDVFRIAGHYQRALETYRSIPHMPPSVQAEVAACLVGLGQLDEAREEMNRYHELARAQMAHYPRSETAWRQYWYEVVPCERDEDFEVLYAQLVEAGLHDHLAEPDWETPSIAVLPFENMSGDPEQAFFSDGITADIIATLSKFRHLRIVARHSTEIYRNRKASIAEIAGEQGVGYILEGSVRKSGDKIRVNVELVDTRSEQNIWSERYDRDLDDIFAVQDEITRNIAVAMKVQLTDGERSASRTEGTRNVKAWELVLLAVDLQDSYIQRNILDSRKMIQQALKLDPEFASAWVNLGWTHWQEAYGGWTDSFELSMREARTAVDKALAIEPDSCEAWALMSTIHLMNHEADKAAAACQRALELEPGNAEVQALAGFAMNFIGDYEKAAENFNRAVNLCPICPNWYYLIGADTELEAGNLDQAIELLRKGVAAEPDSPLIRFYLAEAMLIRGDEDAARVLAAEIKKLDKTMNGRGLVRSYSHDSNKRDRFQQNLAKLDLI